MGAGGALRIRSCTPEDGEAIVALYRAAFAREHSLRRFRWQYLEVPGADPGCSVGCWSGGELVGLAAAIPLELSVEGRRRVVPRVQDVCVHPAHRRQGHFGRLLDALIQRHGELGHPLAYGLPNASSFPALTKPWRYLPVAELRVWGCRVEPSLAEERTALRVEIGPAGDFDARDTACFERALGAHPIRNARGPAYLNWRFGPTAPQRYVAVRAWEGEQLRGLMVAKHYASGGTVDLVEIAAEPEPALLRDLLIGAQRAFPGVRDLQLWALAHDPTLPALRRLGFAPGERRLPLIARASTAGETTLWRRPQAWYLAMGDSDVA